MPAYPVPASQTLMLQNRTDMPYNKRMLGVVTLYQPQVDETAQNILTYIGDLDALIVWDNSPLEARLQQQLKEKLGLHWTKIVWEGNGQNRCIAPAINYAWQLACERQFDFVLIMDDDSSWTDFASFRQEVEHTASEGEVMVLTPFVEGVDAFQPSANRQPRRLFINSGTVLPTEVLSAIGGVDEEAFPLDALDHDIALSVIEHGYKAVCLTRHRLVHKLGQPQCLGPFHLFTPNYNRFRTYQMTRSHIICYRKHRPLMTATDRDYLLQEIIRRKFVRILLAEPDKLGRMLALIRGIVHGCRYKIRKTANATT